MSNTLHLPRPNGLPTPPPPRGFKGLVTGESFPGMLLLGATVAALLWANSPAASTYFGLLGTPVVLGFGDLSLTKALVLWINDGLMAVFFLLVGLEIKREVVEGQLSSRRKATLPLAAAVGGMVLPALLYLAVTAGSDGARGWGVPMATDIAFALGVLAVVGSRAPIALKVFLTAVAVVDDLGAVAVIALFYTESVSVAALGVAGGVLALLVALNRAGVRSLLPYLALGLVLWVAVLKSGVHATVAGVVLAMAIPSRRSSDGSPLVRLEHALHPWSMYFIVPVFALANAGVAFGGGESALLGAVGLGVAAGLVIGKPVGVVGMSWLVVRMGWAELPRGVTWAHLGAAGMLTGIGFTMSLFVGQLAFGPGVLLEQAKLGILLASLVSATGAWWLLRHSLRATGTGDAERPVLPPYAEPTPAEIHPAA